jgi:hypothetical protein
MIEEVRLHSDSRWGFRIYPPPRCACVSLQTIWRPWIRYFNLLF